MADLDIGKLIASLGLDPREFNRAMKQVEQQMNQANKIMTQSTRKWQDQFRDVGRQMQRVGKQMTMFITLPMIGAGVGAFKMQKDFEKSMSMITGLVGVAREQVQAWRADVLSMADALGKSPKELADALYFVTSAGVKGAEAMQVLEMSAKASVAGLGETKIVADAVTSAINAYGKENISAAEATDVLVAAVREGKAEAAGFAGSIGMVIPVASAMGVSFGEIAGVIAGMTRTGTGVETAAMQLKNILAVILKGGTKESEKLLGELGSSFEDLRHKVKEEGVLSALLELNRLTSLNADTMSLLFPNIRALTGVLDLLGNNLEENKIIIDKVIHSTGALSRAFEVASNTSEFTYQQAINSVKIALIEFGVAVKDTILPIMQGFIKRVREMTKWFKDLDDQQKKNIIRIVALVAALGPLITIMGKLMVLIAANPYLALGAAIAMVVLGLMKWSTKAKEVIENQQGLFNANQRVNKQYSEQAAEIKKLVWAIENENLTNEQRINAINELKTILPDYNAKLTKEGELIGHNADEIERYVKGLREKIRLSVHEDELKEVFKKQADLQNQIRDAREQEKEQMYAISQMMGGVMGSEADVSKQTAENMLIVLRAFIGNLQTESDNLEEEARKIQETMNSLLTGKPKPKTKTAPGATGTGGGAIEKSPLFQKQDTWLSDVYMMGLQLDQMFIDLDRDVTNFSLSTIEAETNLEGWFHVINSVEGAFATFFSNIGKGFDQMLAGFVNMLNQMMAQMAAKAVMFLILDLISGGTGTLAELAGELTKGGFKSFMGFANGGVVPPGYPGDTYPALLTSGETVVPAGQPSALGGYVEFEIRGDRLVGILQKIDKKRGIT